MKCETCTAGEDHKEQALNKDSDIDNNYDWLITEDFHNVPSRERG